MIKSQCCNAEIEAPVLHNIQNVGYCSNCQDTIYLTPSLTEEQKGLLASWQDALRELIMMQTSAPSNSAYDKEWWNFVNSLLRAKEAQIRQEYEGKLNQATSEDSSVVQVDTNKMVANDPEIPESSNPVLTKESLEAAKNVFKYALSHDICNHEKGYCSNKNPNDTKKPESSECECRCHTHIPDKEDASCCLGKPPSCEHCLKPKSSKCKKCKCHCVIPQCEKWHDWKHIIVSCEHCRPFPQPERAEEWEARLHCGYLNDYGCGQYDEFGPCEGCEHNRALIKSLLQKERERAAGIVKQEWPITAPFPPDTCINKILDQAKNEILNS